MNRANSPRDIDFDSTQWAETRGGPTRPGLPYNNSNSNKNDSNNNNNDNPITE